MSTHAVTYYEIHCDEPGCAECDNTKDLELDEPEGDLYCPICLAYERNKKK